LKIPNPRIVVAGSVSSTHRTLRSLLEHKADVVGVAGLSRKYAHKVSGYAGLDDLAADAHLPYCTFDNINAPDVVSAIADWKPDLLFVVGLSQVVGDALLQVPTIGCIGFHPTRLPVGRGRAPLAWLVMDGQPGAATFFLIDDGVDSGPVLVQQVFDVGSDDYASDIVSKIDLAMKIALDRLIPQLIAGTWQEVPQCTDAASCLARRAPSDGWLDWHMSAQRLYRIVRATSHPHPGAYTYYRGARLIVWRCTVEKRMRIRGVTGRIVHMDIPQRPLVQTGDGLLWLDEVEWAAPVNPEGAIFIVGSKLGYCAEDEIHNLKKRIAQLEESVNRLTKPTPSEVKM